MWGDTGRGRGRGGPAREVDAHKGGRASSFSFSSLPEHLNIFIFVCFFSFAALEGAAPRAVLVVEFARARAQELGALTRAIRYVGRVGAVRR